MVHAEGRANESAGWERRRGEGQGFLAPRDGVREWAGRTASKWVAGVVRRHQEGLRGYCDTVGEAMVDRAKTRACFLMRERCTAATDWLVGCVISHAVEVIRTGLGLGLRLGLG